MVAVGSQRREEKPNKPTDEMTKGAYRWRNGGVTMAKRRGSNRRGVAASVAAAGQLCQPNGGQ